jgi:hypothetical protein
MLKKLFKKNENYNDIKFDKKVKKYYQTYYAEFKNFKELVNHFKKIN